MNNQENKTAEQVFKAAFLKASGKEADATIMQHMSYAIAAMEEYAQLLEIAELKEQKITEKIEERKPIKIDIWLSNRDILRYEKHEFESVTYDLAERWIEVKTKKGTDIFSGCKFQVTNLK